MTIADRLIEEGIQKGIQKGIQEGMQKGMKEKAVRVAKKLLMRGMSIEEVVELTELSREEVAEIEKEVKMKLL